jgi:hypothetical protein
MSWFNKSEKAVNVEMWFDRVKEIPDEAFPSIVNQICDSAKYFPTPQDVRNLFEDWLASHPEKQTVHHRTWCDDCGGTGALRVRIKEKHFTRDSMYRCRACKNWEGSLGTWIPLKYRSELEHLSAVTVLEHREGDRSEQTKKHDFGIPDRPRGGVSHVSEVVAQVSANDSIPF